MTDRPWWRDAVVYQIYPRSFADGNGDGVGDLPGIASRVDHLADLGVDIVWLSPVYASPQDDNGYDISDYYAIDPVFGTVQDMDALIAALHARGIRLVMDLVVNHTSDEHAWFRESRAAVTSAKRDWYWWRPAREGMRPGAPGAEPTNWAAAFGGPAWAFDETTGEYYLHLFSTKQPDLNWENPAVRQAVYTMMRWWLDRGVDGFRMDVIDMISKVPGLPDGHPGSAGTAQGLLADGSEHFICGPRLHEFLAEMHEEVFADRPERPITVGETPGITVEEARLITDPARRELDMVFQFEHVGLDQGATKWDRRPLDLRELKASLARWQAGLADVGWNSLYWDNHDQPRAVSRFGDDAPAYRDLSAKVLAAVLHLHRGTPYIYQGEELGMANVPFATIDDFRDIESLGHYRDAVARGADPEAVLADLRRRSRDNARTPMQWTAAPHAGFTTGTPWMPVNPDHVRVNAEAQRRDPDSVLHFYRRLIALRHHDPLVVDGDFTLLLPSSERVWAFTRRLASPDGGAELLVLANLTRDEVTVGPDPGVDPAPDPGLDPAAWSTAEVVLGNYPDPAGGARASDGAPASVLGRALRAWEVVVLRRTWGSPSW